MPWSVLVALLIGCVLPAFTAVLTRETALPSTKALVTAVLSVIAGLVSILAFITPQTSAGWWALVLTTAISMLTAWVMYFLAYKPSGLSHEIHSRTYKFGFK